uniref:Uncharacterized protein n=1 Tax=Arundo donax TaxID=35708 RepID=A0A0A9F3Q4_ARUDO
MARAAPASRTAARLAATAKHRRRWGCGCCWEREGKRRRSGRRRRARCGWEARSGSARRRWIGRRRGGKRRGGIRGGEYGSCEAAREGVVVRRVRARRVVAGNGRGVAVAVSLPAETGGARRCPRRRGGEEEVVAWLRRAAPWCQMARAWVREEERFATAAAAAAAAAQRRSIRRRRVRE